MPKFDVSITFDIASNIDEQQLTQAIIRGFNTKEFMWAGKLTVNFVSKLDAAATVTKPGVMGPTK